MLRVENLRKYYGDFLAVDNISFTLNSGEALGLIGSNGAGKSTTIKMIIGLIEASSGSIHIENEPMSISNIRLKHKIGYMPEESSLYEDIDAVTFLRFFSEIYNIPKPISEKKISTLLSDLKLENKLISLMSKGMKRKLLIARSLLPNPKILVYDEPASGIDPETTAFILDYILSLKKRGKIIIMTAHNLSHVEKISDKVMILKKGRIMFYDTISSIKQDKAYVLKYIHGNKLLEREFKDIKSLNDELAKIISMKATILEFSQKEHSLEDIFLNIAKKK